MIVIPSTRHAGVTGKPGAQFTGAVHPYMTMPATDGVTINTVNFTPCSRTFWHYHEKGQILIVLAGRGLIQAEDGAPQVIRAGDTIWAAPGERHWHGGSPQSFMTHTAISLGVTTWFDEVTEGEYNAVSIDGGA